jgi:hypothetical protein
MDKSAILKAFNKYFFEFIEDIISILPENNDLKVARDSFEMIRKANPTTILKAWYSAVQVPYGSIIETGDIRFFFNKDYTEDLKDVNNQSHIMSVIDKIREPIKNMSPENIAHSAKYIQNLGKLAVIYVGK